MGTSPSNYDCLASGLTVVAGALTRLTRLSIPSSLSPQPPSDVNLETAGCVIDSSQQLHQWQAKVQNNTGDLHCCVERIRRAR
jgi:hypothetical protein